MSVKSEWQNSAGSVTQSWKTAAKGFNGMACQFQTESGAYGEPVSTAEELATFDHADILEGYNDGFDDAPEPNGNRSKGYWHGWRNGMTDRGRLPVHPNGITLIKSMRIARLTAKES